MGTMKTGNNSTRETAARIRSLRFAFRLASYGAERLLIFSLTVPMFFSQGCSRIDSIVVTPSSTNVSITQNVFFTAKGSSPAAQFTWEVNGIPGGNAQVGVIVWSGTATGFVGKYTAPAAIPAPSTVTVTAMLKGNPTSRASGSANIGPLISISPTISTSVQTYSTMQFFATVTGGPNNAVTWQVGCNQGGTACGAISQTGLFHAPNAVPTTTEGSNIVPDVVMVTAVSQADSRFSENEAVPISSFNQQPQQAPIQLGSSGSNANSSCPNATVPDCSVGTLGALVTRGGTQYILSNAHVLAGLSGGTVGDAILQPGLKDVGCNAAQATAVANLSQFTNPQTDPGTKVDAAIAQVVSGAVDSTGAIQELGATVANGIPQAGPPAQGAGMAASVGQSVAKSGRSTGLTCATVEAVNVSAQVTYPSFCSSPSFTVTYADEVMIVNSGFSAGGDSGSLIVDAATAQPVALLVAMDATTAIANPVSDVLNALKDATGNTPTFVGGAPHAVAACSLPAPAASAIEKTMPASPEAIRRAEDVKNSHAAELLGKSAVVAVGAGPSLDAPGEAAVLVFVRKGADRHSLPPELEGVRTRFVETDSSSVRGLLDASQTEQLLGEAGSKPSKALSSNAIQGAVAVKKQNAEQWMTDPAIQAVGVAASLDSPGDPALIFYVLKAKSHAGIPITINGYRTQLKETLGFTAGMGFSQNRPGCPAFLRKAAYSRTEKK